MVPTEEKVRGYRYKKGDKWDDEILRWLSRLGYSVAEDLQYLTGRNIQSVWLRLRALNFTGYATFKRHPENPFLRVWYLTQKGWDRAHELGFTSYRISATDEKKPSKIPHDLIISKFLVSLVRLERDGVIQDLGFTTHYREMHDRWDRHDAEARINPDAAFWFTRNGVHPFFFLEVERDGKDRLLKALRYAGYPLHRFEKKHGFDDFFALSLFETVAKTLNYIDELRTAENRYLRSPKFWAGDFSLVGRPLAKEFLTPKGEPLSLLDAADFK